MSQEFLSPPMMTATLLLAGVLAVAGTFSLWRMRGTIPALEAARRVIRTARTEKYVTRGSTVALVIGAVVILFFLL
jgi:hypothetical protein